MFKRNQNHNSYLVHDFEPIYGFTLNNTSLGRISIRNTELRIFVAKRLVTVRLSVGKRKGIKKNIWFPFKLVPKNSTRGTLSTCAKK